MTASGDSDQFSEYERRRRLFLDEWRVAIEPDERRVSDAARGAIDFAQTGLRSLFILHGGALVVLPAYLALSDSSVNLWSSNDLAAPLSYVVGLVLTALGTLVAYLTMVEQGRHAYQSSQAKAMTLANTYHLSIDVPVTHAIPQIQQIEADAQKTHKRAERLRSAGIGLAFISLVAFIFGTVFAAELLRIASGSTPAGL